MTAKLFSSKLSPQHFQKGVMFYYLLVLHSGFLERYGLASYVTRLINLQNHNRFSSRMNGGYFQNSTLSHILVVLKAIEQSKDVLDAHTMQITQHKPIKQIQSTLEGLLRMSPSNE